MTRDTWLDIIINRYLECKPTSFDLSSVKEFRYGRDVDELIVEFKDGTKDIYDDIYQRCQHILSAEDIPDYHSQDAYKKWFAHNLDRQLYRNHFPNWRLAKSTGLSETIISQYLNAKTLPNVINIVKIVRALGIRYDDIMDPYRVYKL